MSSAGRIDPMSAWPTIKRCKGRDQVWSPMTKAPAMVWSPITKRTRLTSSVMPMTQALGTIRHASLSPRMIATRSAFLPPPTEPMIDTFKPVNMVTLKGTPFTYERFHARHVGADNFSLRQGRGPKDIQRVDAADRIEDLRDVAGGVNIGHAGLQMFVDRDPLVHHQAGLLGQVRARTHADGDREEATGDVFAGLGFDRGKLAT